MQKADMLPAYSWGMPSTDGKEGIEQMHPNARNCFPRISVSLWLEILLQITKIVYIWTLSVQMKKVTGQGEKELFQGLRKKELRMRNKP